MIAEIKTKTTFWTIINRHDEKIYELSHEEFKYLLEKAEKSKEYQHIVKLKGQFIERANREIWIDAEINKPYMRGAF